jgi:hypothetical protein
MKKINLLIGVFLLIVGSVIWIGCGEKLTSSLNEPEITGGIPAEDVQWVPAKADFVNQVNALGKKVFDCAMITPKWGGVVGGKGTYNNMVVFPPNAVDRFTWVTVKVVMDRNNVAVEFLPSGSFNEYVEVTLSYAHLDIDEDIESLLKVYFSQDDGSHWNLVDSQVTFDHENKTATFLTDHFTRYGWGI